MKTKSLLKSLMDLLFRSFFARKYCASTSLLTVSENLLKNIAFWQMTETRLFEYFPTTVYSETAKYEASSSHFLQKSWRKKKTLDFILCQSRKLYEESWNEECFFEGFPNDEFSATAKKEGVPRVGSVLRCGSAQILQWILSLEWSKARFSFSQLLSYEKIPADWSMSLIVFVPSSL